MKSGYIYPSSYELNAYNVDYQLPGVEVPSSSLVNGLLAFYKLSDTSDAAGSRVLTDNGPCPFSAGKIGNAAGQFTGNNSEFLNRTDSVFRPTTAQAYTFSAWLKPSYSFLQTGFVVCVGAIGSNAIFGCFVEATGQLDFNFGTGANMYATVPGNNNNIWGHYVWWYDPADSKARVRVNDTTTYVSSVACNWTFAGTEGLVIGKGTAGHQGKGWVDAFGVWNRLLTPGEMTSLYNGGAGIEYPF